MKKKDAIERLATELRHRDAAQLEAATAAAGSAATVTPAERDYDALAQELLERAVVELTLERALQNLSGVRTSVTDTAPLMPPNEMPYALRDYCPTGKADCNTLAAMLERGWDKHSLLDHDYITHK